MYILIILLSLWTVFITSHHGLHRYSSHATSDSSPATTVDVTPPRSFQLSILKNNAENITFMVIYHRKYVHLFTRNMHMFYQSLWTTIYMIKAWLGYKWVFSIIFIKLTHNNRIWSIMTCSHIHIHQQYIHILHQYG